MKLLAWDELTRRHETMGDLAEQGFTRDQVLETLRILPFVSGHEAQVLIGRWKRPRHEADSSTPL